MLIALLRLVTFMGMLSCLLSMLMVLVVLHRKLTGGIGIEGWTTVVILISFFSGLIMLSLGIMGEYMSRILSEVRGGPPFLIREQLMGSQAGSVPTPSISSFQENTH
jgi:hypothetical protein